MNSLKLRSRQSGYILLLLMLVIGSIGLYLTYQFSLKKMGTQSWQLAKTATEFSYWMDIEQNYELDYAGDLNLGTTTEIAANYNNIKLLDLINKHYLPYGMARSTTFTNSTINQVSEFLCSPLPGINAQTSTLTWNGDNETCPNAGIITTHCELAATDNVYYSCANNVATSQAQYYINANYISIGNNGTQHVGLGLILPTSGTAASSVSIAPGTRGILPNGSAAQSLMSTLPGAAFNVYATQNPQVNAIGVASYLSNQILQPLQQNNRYSKIIDMGLVQAVDLNKVKGLINAGTSPCYGWDGDTKTGVGSSYDGSTAPSSGTNFPPTCIRINTALPQYHACKQIDVLYTMYRNYTNMGSPSQFYSYTDSYIQTDGNIRNVFLSQSLQNQNAGRTSMASTGTYTSNGGIGGTTNGGRNANQKDTWLAYIVRCTQDNV